MSDIRNYFKKTSSTNPKRTREDDEDIVPKNKQSVERSSSAKKVKSETSVTISKKPQTSVTQKGKSEATNSRTGSASSSTRKSTVEFTTTKNEPKSSQKTKFESSTSKKTSTTENSEKNSVDLSEKRRRTQNFQAFRNRAGPSALGSKEIPEGQKNCLNGLTFVISGVLESLERDESKALIERYGGRVTSAISGKTNFLLLGREGSDAKEQKAKEMKIPILSEDELLEIIRTRPGEKSTEPKTNSKAKSKAKATSSTPTTMTVELSPSTTKSADERSELWVDKYKPQSIKNLIGQQGEKSPVQKLLVWLRDWSKYHGQIDEKVKAKSSFGFNRNEDPTMFKAALLSGPPGIGKTTAAQLVCKELNFDFIEKNASDQRSKKSITKISNDSQSIAQMLKSSTISRNVLIMDEVDGVSGNEDRGGIQELISLIKRSRVPIICICNDRQHKKIRTLANYCYDLRFSRPTVQQIRGSILTILHREKIGEIKNEILDEIIQSCNQDIRQTIHSLNLWANDGAANGRKAAKMIDKNVNNNPFELCRISFSNEFRSKSLNEKSEIFFSDYQLMPLLVQENYLSSQPYLSTSETRKGKLSDLNHLKLLSAAADNISLGDICSQMIYSRQDSWSLLPYQAIFSTVSPCSYVRGSLRGPVAFSSFFGQRSRTNKNERLLNEIEKHMCLKIGSGNKQQFNLDYLPYLSRALLNPLKKLSVDEGVEKCIELLDNYYLTRDDFQTLIELNTWGKGNRNLYDQLETQVKSSLTRNYNKKTHRTPYTTIDLKKLKRTKEMTDENSDDDQDEDQTDDKDESNAPEADNMIKIKTQRSSKPSSKPIRKKK